MLLNEIKETANGVFSHELEKSSTLGIQMKVTRDCAFEEARLLLVVPGIAIGLG